LAWIPSGHNLRLSPPIIMSKEIAAKGIEIIEESIRETEKEMM
jgi:4-aminobutyrate aminotransferase-like enzyme